MADLSEIEFGFSLSRYITFSFKFQGRLDAVRHSVRHIFFSPFKSPDSLEQPWYASLTYMVNSQFQQWHQQCPDNSKKKKQKQQQMAYLFMCACMCASWGVGWAMGWFFCPCNHDNSHLETAGKEGMVTYTQGDSDVWGPPRFLLLCNFFVCVHEGVYTNVCVESKLIHFNICRPNLTSVISIFRLRIQIIRYIPK